MNNEDMQNEELEDINKAPDKFAEDDGSEEPQYKEYSDEYLTSALEAILFSVGESVP